MSDINEEKKEEEFRKDVIKYTKRIEQNSADCFAYFRRGFSYYLLNELSKSVVDLSKAITLNPNDDYYYYVQGRAYMKLREFEKAKVSFDHAIRFSNKPKNYSNSYYRGECFFEMGEYKKSLTDFEKTIQLHPNHSRASKMITKITERINELFFRCVSENDVEKVKYFLKTFPGLNPNWKDNENKSSLEIACQNRNIEILKETLLHPNVIVERELFENEEYSEEIKHLLVNFKRGLSGDVGRKKKKKEKSGEGEEEEEEEEGEDKGLT